MSTQSNKNLAVAVLRARNGEIPGFEDFYLLTCQNTLSDIQGTVRDEKESWEILSEVYTEVWKRRDNIPETGIVRPWIRVLIREVSKRRGGTLIEEFSGESVSEAERDSKEHMVDILVQIEEELGLLTLPDNILGRRRHSGAVTVIIKFFLGLGFIALSVCAVFLLLRMLRHEAASLQELEPVSEESSEILAVEQTEATAAEPAEQPGWNVTKEGRRYKNPDGSWHEGGWLEDGNALYYLNEDGYALSGRLALENQNFIFNDEGVLKSITRSYALEDHETIVSVQMKEYGYQEDAERIIRHSIVLDGDWIYFMIADEDGEEGAVLYRARRGADEYQLISENVSGYTVQNDALWYCKGGSVIRFEKADTEYVKPEEDAVESAAFTEGLSEDQMVEAFPSSE